MIAVSLKDGDDLVNLFLNKEADVNQTSKQNAEFNCKISNAFKDFSGQVSCLVWCRDPLLTPLVCFALCCLQEQLGRRKETVVK